MTEPDEIVVPCGRTIFGEDEALDHELACEDCKTRRRAEQTIGPDCRDGKHTACHGDAWDDINDELTDCACCRNGHR